MIRVPLVAMACCLAIGCGVAPDRSSNQMMLVRETPATLGYRRLMAKSARIGDLKIFIEERGLPDFVAEASSTDREYLFFYYLKSHQAFACRTRAGRPGAVEFLGPSPMTTGEWKLLNGVKTQADKRLNVD